MWGIARGPARDQCAREFLVMTRVSKLRTLIAELKRQHGTVAPPPASDAFQLVAWEKVAYLATDEKREAAFHRLSRDVGLTPRDVLKAKRSAVIDALATGGINPIERANNLI